MSRRLRPLDVTTVEADVLKPFPVEGPVDSAALHAVIHCLPGPIERKAAAVANVAAALATTGILFGASVFGTSGHRTWTARTFLDVFNRQCCFDNLGDTEDGLRAIQCASFKQVEVAALGSIAVFAASNHRSAAA